MLETTARDFTWNTAGEIAAAVEGGRISALSIIEATLARIRSRDPLLNSFTATIEQRALVRARAVDEALARGEPSLALAGVPFAVKNLFDVTGLATIAGSKINRDAKPATRDATLIERLVAAGAILVGALNMGEYAYDFTGENAHDGPSRNPHDLNRMSGGSSGGSAAAVAGGLVPLALASDTNGSIRVPASLCGLFGLKPTYGRLSLCRHFSIRDEPRSCRPAGALGPRSRARLRRDAGLRSARSGLRRPSTGASDSTFWTAALTDFALPSPEDISKAWRQSRSTPSIVWR